MDDNKTCECFYALLPEYWGQGLAIEAMKQLLDYGFFELGISKIIAHINKDNPNSIKVAKKLNMKCEKLVEFRGIPLQGKLFSISKNDII